MYVNMHGNLNGYSVIALVWYIHVLSSAKCYVGFTQISFQIHK